MRDGITMKTRIWLVLAFWALALTGCGGPTTAPAPTTTPATNPPATAPFPTMPPPTATSAPTATTAPTATPTPLATATPTATPLPTDTPSPSPTPAPAASVTGDSINVRGGPGTVYPVVGQAKKGEALPVIARTQDGAWLEVTLTDGKQGWVSAKLVTLNVPTESVPIAKSIPPTPAAPPPASITVKAISNLRMIAAGRPKNPGQAAFPTGVSVVWCAFEIDGAKLQRGDAYTLNLIDPLSASILTVNLLGPDNKIYQGTAIVIGEKGDFRFLAVPVYAPGGSFSNGGYRSEIRLNGEAKATIRWSVGP